MVVVRVTDFMSDDLPTPNHVLKRSNTYTHTRSNTYTLIWSQTFKQCSYPGRRDVQRSDDARGEYLIVCPPTKT